MRRILAVTVSVIFMFTGCSERKPRASDGATAYVPTTVGDKWVTADIAVGVPPYERTSEVTEVEAKEGALFVTITISVKGHQVARRDVVKVSDAGMFLVESGTAHYDPPIRRLPLPLKVGDTWEWEKPGVAKWKYKAIKEEEVEVPAGKFKALRVEGEGTIQEPAIKAVRPAKVTEWVSPGYPTIKTITKVGDGSETCDGETTTVLKSFTPSKKE
jgi:hypothetical protein